MYLKMGKGPDSPGYFVRKGWWEIEPHPKVMVTVFGKLVALDGRNRNTRRKIMKNVYEFMSGAELSDVEMVCEAHHNCKNAEALAESLAKSFVEGIAFAKVIEQKKGEDYILTVIRVNNRIMRDLVVIR